MHHIVVGIDGSDGSRRALRWGVEEAIIRETYVVALHAWMMPREAAIVSLPPYEEFVRAAEELLNEVISETLKEDDDVRVEPRVVESGPVDALTEASKDAALIVMGSRGLGGFTGLLLGSVSHQCAHRSRCPVTILPPSH